MFRKPNIDSKKKKKKNIEEEDDERENVLERKQTDITHKKYKTHVILLKN